MYNNTCACINTTTHKIRLFAYKSWLDYKFKWPSKKTKSRVSIRISRKESTVSNQQPVVLKLMTSKKQILQTTLMFMMVLDAS